MDNPVITCENVSYSYNGINALEEVTLDIYDKDFLGIIGPNGGGKTTILRIILGFLHPSTGKIRVFGKQPKYSRHLIGYVPQYGSMDSTIPVTVEEVVAMGASRPGDLFPRLRPSQRETAHEMMSLAGIEDLAKRPFSALSGGQRQRCLIARALASRPGLLLLDEPTANVDSTKERDLYELFRELNQQMTILLVSHDVGFITSYVNRVACVNHRISVHPTNEITTDSILRDTYTSDTVMIRHQCEL